VRRGVPIVFLDFPRLVHDPKYLYWQLAPIIGHCVQHVAAIKAHRRVAKPELVRAKKSWRKALKWNSHPSLLSIEPPSLENSDAFLRSRNSTKKDYCDIARQL
jgi:hypothetical protein